MSNQIKYKGVTYAEDKQILKTGGVLYQVKELPADALEGDSLQMTVESASDTLLRFALNDKVEYFRDGRRQGVYYLQSVTQVGPRAYQLYALSAVGRLMAQRHVGGLYTGQRADAVVREICGDIPVLVETCYASRALYGWLPYAPGRGARSARDNLADLLLAVGAWLGTDENGVLRVEKLWDGTASAIPIGRIDSRNVQVKTDAPVSAVEVTEHQYVPSAETQSLFNGTATEGKRIVFDEPMHDLSATGFTILESGANYAVLSAGTGELTGQTYTHNTSIVTRTVTEGAAENIIPVSSVYLISLVNSVDVATRLADYYRHRTAIAVDVNPRGERAGHVVDIYHPWEKALVSACIASRETKVSGLLKSRTTALVGFVPPQPDEAEYYDERVFLTGSGEWEVPPDVTTYTRVLVGAGQGGKCGNKGEDGKQRSASWTETSLITVNWSGYLHGAVAKGGAGGEGGTGGKVFVEVISDAVQGTKVAYSCGVGGGGATEDGTEGASGTATTMGGASSDNGSSSDGGYYDNLTGEVFAAKGDTGIAGGDSGGCSDVNAYPNPMVSGAMIIGEGIAGATTVVDEDGVAWRGGAWTAATGSKTIYGLSDNANYDGNLLDGFVSCFASCSGPSGAAVGARGVDGKTSGIVANAGRTTEDGTVTAIYAYATSAPAVNGANAVVPPKKTSVYGKGGRGGHGGGAGGCAGLAATGKTPYSNVPQNTRATSGGVGTGGLGSDGGEAGDGCIIIYYRRKKTIQSGWAKDKNGKLCLDRLGKRRIV